MSTANHSLLALYTVGGVVATTSVSEGALILKFASPDNHLIGEQSSDTVDRARISFDPGLSEISYVRESSDSGTATGALTVSPNYQAKVLGSDVDRQGEARTLLGLEYSTFAANYGDTADGGSSYAATTNLDVTNDGYLGIRYLSFSGTHYGWLSYKYDGNDVNLGIIAFEGDSSTGVAVGVIPESSTVMAITGGVFAAGLIGVRALRRRKKAQAEVELAV